MAGQVDIVLTEEFKKAYKKLPEDIKKKVEKQMNFPVASYRELQV